MSRWSDKAPLERQLTGLDLLWDRVTGKGVLDIGAAEGDIGLECCRRGASHVYAIEHREPAVKEANRRAREAGANFHAEHADANVWPPIALPHRFDVILMLAVLHKLPEPQRALYRILKQCAKPTATLVLRLRPKDWPVLTDARSGRIKQDLGTVLHVQGFRLVREDKGPVSGGVPEWVGLFERVSLG